MKTQTMQDSKTDNIVGLGTIGWPKDREVHGYGESVVGNSSRRDLEFVSVKAISQLNSFSERNKAFSHIIKEKIGDDLVRFKHLIHLIADLDNLTLAYELIKSNPGNMTPGPDETTLDGMSLDSLKLISKDLKSGVYTFSPARRTRRIYIPNIPKPGKSEKHPLGIAKPFEKVVLEAFQLVLEKIWEPLFLTESHGFRPGRGTHTALRLMKYSFKGVAWVVEADISKCFDKIDHAVLLQILAKKIACDKTLGLIKKACKAGYIDPQGFVNSDEGTQQGSVLSPLLCNIYLHELDVFIKNTLASIQGPNSRRKINPEYSKICRKITLASEERKELIKQRRVISSKDIHDPQFTKGVFVRHADDFVIGIIGPKKLAQTITVKIRQFLKNELKLELNDPLITPFKRKGVDFLGVEASYTSQVKITKRTSDGAKLRIAPNVKMRAPILKILLRLTAKGFVIRGEDSFNGRTRTTLLNLDHADILQSYNSVIRGISNYYSFVDNRASLIKVFHLLKDSCARTLAAKYKLGTRALVYKKYGKSLVCPKSGNRLQLPSNYKVTGKFLINPDPNFATRNFLKLTR